MNFILLCKHIRTVNGSLERVLGKPYITKLGTGVGVSEARWENFFSGRK